MINYNRNHNKTINNNVHTSLAGGRNNNNSNFQVILQLKLKRKSNNRKTRMLTQRHQFTLGHRYGSSSWTTGGYYMYNAKQAT